MIYNQRDVGVGSHTINGVVCQIRGANYPNPSSTYIDIYNNRYKKYKDSNSYTIISDQLMVPYSIEEYRAVRPEFNELGIEHFYRLAARPIEYEDLPYEVLTCSFAVKNKFYIGDIVDDGEIVGICSASYYIKGYPDADFLVWDRDYPNWTSKPLYAIKLNNPVKQMSFDDFCLQFKEDLKYYKEEYWEKLYDCKVNMRTFLSLPEDAINEYK